MTLANITNAVSSYAKALLLAGSNPSFTSWDNDKTYHLNLLLLVSTIGSGVFVVVNALLDFPEMVICGLSIITFNCIIFTLQAIRLPYLARTITCVGYPLLFFLMIVVGKGSIKGEYAFFLMILLCVLFFRRQWRQLAMIAFVFVFYLLSQLILLIDFGAIESGSIVVTNSIVFLSIAFGVVFITNNFIRQVIDSSKRNRQLLAELEHSNEELKRLNYMVSHDLRTPLRQIVSFSKLAQMSSQQGESSTSQEYMELIEHSAKELYQMTENLLSLAHLDQNQLKTEPIRLSDHFDKIERQFSKIEGNQLIMIHNLAENDVLDASPILLQMILQNLVENGIKYNESSTKEIWLEVEAATDETKNPCA